MRHRKIAPKIYYTCCGANASIFSKTIQSRKRKLWELYAVTTATEPIPHFRDAPLDSTIDTAFNGFIDQNDIEK